MTAPKRAPSDTTIAIVGGGLSGMAAAAAIAQTGLRVELFEGRKQLGGRATSFFDDASGQWIDHCQHVSMGCCTNLADFFHRADATELFRRDKRLHWIAADGRRFELAASGWLPAPLHLAPGLWRLQFLTAGARIGIARALLAMARTAPSDLPDNTSIAAWLRERRQSTAAIEGFWQPVLISALADTLERASYAAARQVFVEGFMGNRGSYVVELPRVSLSELYDQHVGDWLERCGVTLHRQTQIRSLVIEERGCREIVLADDTRQPFDRIVLAVPWHKLVSLMPPVEATTSGIVQHAAELESSPITAVHLWFDQAITELPHAVLPGRTSQWLFQRPSGDDTHYYQIVISGSRSLSDQDRQQIVRDVCGELADIWPEARDAKLVRSLVVTDRNAVFSPQPGHDAHRPAATTQIEELFLAGDWTATGWPATMEGAVRSGYLAAEAVLASLGQPTQLVVPERPRQWLARWLIR